jgi:hypothetical protein
MYLIKLVIGTVIGIVLMLIHLLLGLPPFRYLMVALYFWWFTVMPLVLQSLVYIFLFSVFFVIAVFMWIADTLTLGVVRKYTRCENLPSMWFERANYISGNVYKRLMVVCQKPCGSRFEPSKSSGMACSKQEPYVPEYCPEAQIYRIYKGLETSSPEMYDEFKPSSKFWTKTQKQREDEVKEYFVNRQKFLDTCSKTNQQYDNIISMVCSNWDNINIPNEEKRSSLRSLCSQVYCTGENKSDFCSKLDSSSFKPSTHDKPEPHNVVKRIIQMIVGIIICMIVLIMTLHHSK